MMGVLNHVMIGMLSQILGCDAKSDVKMGGLKQMLKWGGTKSDVKMEGG